MSRVTAFSLFFFSMLTLCGCQGGGFQKMSANEHGVVFSALPRFVGGGIKSRVLQPGEMEFVLPWESVYRLDTSKQSIGWGGLGQGGNKTEEDFVETRSLDGNEVGLAVTVQYHVDPKRIGYVIERVGTSDEKIRQFVAALARSDIRTHMNVLRTEDFFSSERRQRAVHNLQDVLARRLEPEGILMDEVVYTGHRFERKLADGSVDRSYQEQIDLTQAKKQETQQEMKSIATVIERKTQEYNEAQARFYRAVNEAEGFDRQAKLRGDAALLSKKNEAAQVTAVGMAEVEGLIKQIAALSGPGGKALLRLSLARALSGSDSKFVLLQSGGGERGAIDLNRIDTNELLRQAGVLSVADELGHSRGKHSGPKNRADTVAPESNAADAVLPEPKTEIAPEAPQPQKDGQQ